MSKISVYILDGSAAGTKIAAQFNPKEFSFDKDAGWSEQAGGTGANMGVLQFTSGKNIKISVDLLFDYYEQGNKDVRGTIATIMKTALVDDSIGRPPMVQLFWSDTDILFANGGFTGVVQSVKTKYTMFTSDGVPCRAVASLSLCQAEEVEIAGGAKSAVGKETVGSAQAFSALPESTRNAEMDKGFDPEKGPYPHDVVTGVNPNGTAAE